MNCSYILANLLSGNSYSLGFILATLKYLKNPNSCSNKNSSALPLLSAPLAVLPTLCM